MLSSSFPLRALEAIKAKERALAAKYPLWRRRNFLLYSFQTKYAIWLMALGVLITAIMGVVMYKLFSSSAPDGSLDGVDGAANYDQRFRWIVGGLTMLTLFSFGLFFVLVILVLHRIAGPLLIMSRYMSELAGGKYPVMRPLRDSDELKEFFSHFQSAVGKLRERDSREANAIEHALDTLSPTVSGQRAQEALSGLRVVLEDKRKSLNQE